MKFKVATWNVENLFRFSTQFGPKTKAEYDQKLSNLAAAILNLAPDLLALQEIGSPEAFEDLLKQLGNLYPHRQLSTNPDGRGIRVGFFSKLEIRQFEEIVEFPDAGLPSVPAFNAQGELAETTGLSRGALRIVVEPVQNFSLSLITTHLKSKLLSFPGPNGRTRFSPRNEDERSRTAGFALLKRTAEAVALRVKANEILQSSNSSALVLLGDLNDVTDAATTQILNGPGGSEIGTPGFDRPDKGDAVRLFNLAPLIPTERRFSRINQGNRELIDHILVSQALLLGQPRRVPVVDSHVDLLGALPSITSDPTQRQGKPTSDHAPVSAEFEL